MPLSYERAKAVQMPDQLCDTKVARLISHINIL